MDDGGGSLPSSLEWIDVGLAQTAAVLAGQSATEDWARNYWGATIERERCRAYSLLDESYGETLATPAFHSILSRWRAFIASPDETCMAREQHYYVPLPG